MVKKAPKAGPVVKPPTPAIPASGRTKSLFSSRLSLPLSIFSSAFGLRRSANTQRRSLTGE